MKEILIMRHGKSDWSKDLPDFDRTLNNRGKSNSLFMGNHIKQLSLIPEIIFVSPAKRALETCELFIDSSGFTGEVKEINMFYKNEETEIKVFLKTIDDKYKRIMIIGHNPSFENLTNDLIKDSNRITQMKTACIALLELKKQHWNESDDKNFIMKKYFSP